MLLYVENTSDKLTSLAGKRNALFDTESIDSNIELERFLHIENATNTSSSMLSIEYNLNSWNGLREGSWYNVDLSIFSSFKYASVRQEEPAALFTRAKLTNSNSTIDFTKLLAPKKTANILHAYPDIKDATTHDMTLHVVDCGQGNWNEIHSPKVLLIYDVGASRQYTKAQVANLVNSRSSKFMNRDIHIVISHWDVDHYQALLAFSAQDFKSVKSVTFPSQIPNTTTYKRVAQLLADHNIKTMAIPHAKRLPSEGRSIVLKFTNRIGPYDFYRATTGRSRNQTGIVMSIDGNNKVAILTGDHHYEKILSAIKRRGKYKGKDCILVTPHHGGPAGILNTQDWIAEFGSMTTPISVGANNPFNHPLRKVTDALTTLQGGINRPEETKINQRTLTYNL